MKQGWEIKSLEDVVEFQRGLTYSKKDEVDFSDNIVLRSNNVDLIKNELDLTELKYINPAIEIQESKKVKKGSLLICTANGSKSHLGKVALIDDDYNYAFGGFMGQVTPKEKLDSKFLFYLMTSDNYKKFINELSDGANINNLKFSDLGQFEIPLPPLPEQQRIVSILDEAFATITKAKANAEQNLQNAKELFESYLQGVFEKKGDGWEEKKLGDTCVVERGSSPRPIDKYQTDSPDGVNWIKIGDTKGVGKYIFTTREKITKEGAEKSRYVKEGDFILSNSMSFGKPYIMKTDGYIHDGWFVFRLPEYLDKDFFYYLLTSPNVQKQIQSLGAGAIVKNISGDLVKKVDLFFPKSLKEQQSIVHQLDALRAETQKLEAVYHKKLEDLEELKKSVLQKAFNGELNYKD